MIDPPLAADPMDVSGDGLVTAIDALQVLNHLSRTVGSCNASNPQTMIVTTSMVMHESLRSTR